MIARDDGPVRLTDDETDDILYAVRTNDENDLKQTLSALEQKYSSPSGRILAAAVAEDSGNSAIHYAAANGLTSLLATMLSFLGADPPSTFIDHRNVSGSTALHWGSVNGHLEAVKLLVAAKANLWLRNEAGNLAVFEAERAGHDEVVAYLLQVGGTEKEEERDAQGSVAEGDADVAMDEAAEVEAVAAEGQTEAVGSAADELAGTKLGD